MYFYNINTYILTISPLILLYTFYVFNICILIKYLSMPRDSLSHVFVFVQRCICVYTNTFICAYITPIWGCVYVRETYMIHYIHTCTNTCMFTYIFIWICVYMWDIQNTLQIYIHTHILYIYTRHILI